MRCWTKKIRYVICAFVMGAYVCCFPMNAQAAFTLRLISYANSCLKTAKEWILGANKKVEAVNKWERNLVRGVDKWEEGVNEDISKATQSAVTAVSDATSGAVQYVKDGIASALPGDGFSDSQWFASVKDGVKQFGEAVKPYANLVKNATNPATLVSALTNPDGKGTELKAGDQKQILANSRKFTEESTTTVVGDGTQVLNVVAQYENYEKGVAKATNKSTNITQDIKNRNAVAMGLNTVVNLQLNIDANLLAVSGADISNHMTSLRGDMIPGVDDVLKGGLF